jgi:glycosyltransferase involved in cell wall biosynthesis
LPHEPGTHQSANRSKRLGPGDRIINLGLIPHSEAAAYYENVDALFMPTLLETFGIPYLEAMCFDVPVLTSDLDFAHAVCGEAACYFDPWSAPSMRHAILGVRSDGDLRARLSAAGRQRIRTQFPDWDTWRSRF